MSPTAAPTTPRPMAHPRPTPLRPVLTSLLIAGLAACAPDAPSEGALESAAPGDRFAALESALLEADTVELSYRVTATGAVEADLVGRLRVAAGDTELVGQGTFAGRDLSLSLRADDAVLEWTDGQGALSDSLPAALGEALLIGLTRMGILHNLARLSAAAPPDHAEGGVRDWVRVHGFRASDEIPGGVAFDLVVDGTDSGSATLVFDAEGRPVERRQVVHFPQGDMHVTESYADVVIR